MRPQAADEARLMARIERRADLSLDEIRRAIRQPSVSQTGEGVDAMALWTKDSLHELGAQARLVPGRHAPIVEGELITDASAPTLLLYDLYDVQPAAGQTGWIVDPFAAAIVPGADGRDRLVGRGAFNSKAPLFGTLAVLRTFKEAGIRPPVNIRFLIEGEEEIGSPSLPGYIEANREALAGCDAAFIPYFGTNGAGHTILRLGFKGLILLEFRVTGGDWGGPVAGDIHALHGALVASPAWQLVQALATLVDRQERLAVDGLDDITPGPTSVERSLIDEVAKLHDFEAFRREVRVGRLKSSGPPQDLLAALMHSCTLNIDALAAGTVEEGHDPATIIPQTASAFADLRIVPGMDPDRVVGLIRRHLDRRGFGHVEIRVRSSYPASSTEAGEPVVRALADACRAHGADLRIYPLHAGAAPMHLFSQVLGLPYAFGGLGHGAGAHGPNEYVMADAIVPFMKCVATFFYRFARYQRETRC
ncbi:M20/M25/M40 family metallo-hydrolase [Microvirga pudoricolor]|uniref:M20/M25/M40 family metallo-hydrolase n=1 Tax=Microvirga pudoricolor TaxID=2778729 RepID=UPI001950977B|nr:M20/M25/M40 family metallo-hydrolase [Microvirga pudoricolor]MBM6594028.1 M20/M25/M40 family metallo-hydrolase [Microvirga pudoricolor]